MARIQVGPIEEPYYSTPVPEWKLIAEVRRIAAKLGRRPGDGLRFKEYLRNGGRLDEYHIRESGFAWSSIFFAPNQRRILSAIEANGANKALGKVVANEQVLSAIPEDQSRLCD